MFAIPTHLVLLGQLCQQVFVLEDIGVGVKWGERVEEKRGQLRSKACAESSILHKSRHCYMISEMVTPTLTYGTGRHRENLGAEMSPPGTLLLT